MPSTPSTGTKGPVVRDLQGNLRSAGFHIKPDAIFGPDTYAAVRSFQKSRGLKDDGIVGPDTWKALHHGQTAIPAFDPFDPGDYAKWLSDGVERAGTMMGSLFGSSTSGRPSMPMARAAYPYRPRSRRRRALPPRA